MVDIKEVLSNSYCSIIRDQFNESFIEQKEELSAEIQEIAFIDLLGTVRNSKRRIMQNGLIRPLTSLAEQHLLKRLIVFRNSLRSSSFSFI